MRRVARAALVWLGVMLAACSAEKPAQSATKLRRGPVGTLIGEVLLAPGERLPQYTATDLAHQTLRSSQLPPPPSECAGANESARTPITVTQDGLLRGVVVAASDFTRVSEREPKQQHAYIEHCRLQPSVIAAQAGDTLLLQNRDDYPFEPLIGPSYRAETLKRGEPRRVPFAGAGVDSIQCSLGAPCGRTDVMVFFHPVFTMTDDTGHFRIDNFPASELVRVTAWHPLFEAMETFAWVEPGEQTSLKLQMRPKARFVASVAQQP